MAEDTTKKGGPASATAEAGQRASAGQTEGGRPQGTGARTPAGAQDTQFSGSAPQINEEGYAPGNLSGRELDIARNTGLRTGGTTQAAADQYAALGVNPRLDNRLGRQRPQGAAFAPKPQQFPGPEVGHFEEHNEAMGEQFREMFVDEADPRGMNSPGPHGRGETDELAQLGTENARRLADESGG